MGKEEPRFQIVFEERTLTLGNQILRDNETGVLYLFHFWGNASGLTQLTDREGKPLTSD